MKGNIFRRKGYFAAAAVLLLAMVLQGGGIFAAERIVLTKYPELKMGFTTQNFLQPLPVSLENAKKLVDWASSQGFSWIEYRDPSAKLTLDECREPIMLVRVEFVDARLNAWRIRRIVSLEREKGVRSHAE